MIGRQLLGFFLSPSFGTRVVRNSLHDVGCRFLPNTTLQMMARWLSLVAFRVETEIPSSPGAEFFQQFSAVDISSIDTG